MILKNNALANSARQFIQQLLKTIICEVKIAIKGLIKKSRAGKFSHLLFKFLITI